MDSWLFSLVRNWQITSKIPIIENAYGIFSVLFLFLLFSPLLPKLKIDIHHRSLFPWKQFHTWVLKILCKKMCKNLHLCSSEDGWIEVIRLKWNEAAFTGWIPNHIQMKRQRVSLRVHHGQINCSKCSILVILSKSTSKSKPLVLLWRCKFSSFSRKMKRFEFKVRM